MELHLLQHFPKSCTKLFLPPCPAPAEVHSALCFFALCFLFLACTKEIRITLR